MMKKVALFSFTGSFFLHLILSTVSLEYGLVEGMAQAFFFACTVGVSVVCGFLAGFVFSETRGSCHQHEAMVQALVSERLSPVWRRELLVPLPKDGFGSVAASSDCGAKS